MAQIAICCNIEELRYDTLFQDIFSRLNMHMLTLLFSQLIKKPYEEVVGRFTVENVRLPRTTFNEKQKYCDIVLQMDGHYYIIELNNNYRGVFTRNSTYAFSVINYVYGTTEKKYYNTDIKVTLFNLNWYFYKKDMKREKIEYVYFPRTYDEKDYLLKIVNINLDYYVDKSYNNVDEYEKLF